MTHDWNTLDPLLLRACLLPKPEQTQGALERIGRREGCSVKTLTRRIQFLGLSRIEARMGYKALQHWEKHTKALTKLYRSSIVLHAMVHDRARLVQEEMRRFANQSFSDVQVATFFDVTPKTVRFWAEVVKKLHRDEKGKFPGSELMRFCDHESYLLKGERLVQRNDRVKSTCTTETE